jgi:hypothetical protein
MVTMDDFNEGGEMKIKRYLFGKVHLYFHTWQRWNEFSFDKYWSGRILYFNISKLSFQLDCRGNWIKDMCTGTPE